MGNGKSRYIVMGGSNVFEVWDIKSRSSLRTIRASGYVFASCSVNNIVALCDSHYFLCIYDVKTWELIYWNNYGVSPSSLHLTPDLKFLTIGGNQGQRCIVLQITV